MIPLPLQVRIAELPEMQSLGDSSQTLGFIFASVGVGCLVGPVLMNKFTPPWCEPKDRKNAPAWTGDCRQPEVLPRKFCCGSLGAGACCSRCGLRGDMASFAKKNGARGAHSCTVLHCTDACIIVAAPYVAGNPCAGGEAQLCVIGWLEHGGTLSAIEARLRGPIAAMVSGQPQPLQAFSVIAWPVKNVPTLASITACPSAATLQEARVVEEYGHLLPLPCGWLRLVRQNLCILGHAVHGKAGAGAFGEWRPSGWNCSGLPAAQALLALPCLPVCLQHTHCWVVPVYLPAAQSSVPLPAAVHRDHILLSLCLSCSAIKIQDFTYVCMT